MVDAIAISKLETESVSRKTLNNAIAEMRSMANRVTKKL
jgi:hypothetical protein